MKAFLTGLGIGMGLGVLFAPDSGEATRKKVGDRLRDWSESLSRQADGLKTATRGGDDRVSETTADASGKASDLPPKKGADRESARSERDELINTLGREELMNVTALALCWRTGLFQAGLIHRDASWLSGESFHRVPLTNSNES
jgi:gas vesicle protein